MPAGRTEDSGGRNRAPFQGTSRSTWARQTRQAMLEEKSAISRIARPRPRIEGIVFGLRQSGHLEDRETGQGRDQGHEETDEDRVPGQLARAPRKQDKRSETGARERIWLEPVRSARRNAGREVGASSSFDLDRHLLTGLRSPHAGPEYRSPNSGAAEDRFPPRRRYGDPCRIPERCGAELRRLLPAQWDPAERSALPPT